jgi:penicillin-binding protein 2
MVKSVKYLLTLGAALLLAACGTAQFTTKPTVEKPTATSLPAPVIKTTSTPDARPAAVAFLDAWKTEDYKSMYSMLTRISQDAVDADKFIARYKDIAINLTLSKLDYDIISTLTNPKTAQAAYRVVYHTNLVGDISRDIVMNLALEGNAWKVAWEESLILPELRGGNKLSMDVKVPSRGDIYDRNGKAIVTQAEAVALGIIPGQMGSESNLVGLLAKLTGKTSQSIKALYENAAPNWYIAVGSTTMAEAKAASSNINAIDGLVVNPFTARYYHDGGIAPLSVGYVQYIPKEKIEEYKRKGYRGDEKVGAVGLEKWAENYLVGQRGAGLYVVSPQGQIVTRLAQLDSKPAQNLYTTIDRDLQTQAQKSLEGFRGAAVVLERNTGRVLAMVSSPGFDPNLFEPSNYNSNSLLNQMLNDGQNRLLNRAAQGGYPLGSVFKIITMAAAIESGLYTADTSYMCGHTFTELPGVTLYDWTYAKQYASSGKLSLSEGLMRSCNPWFWHIGLDVYRQKGNTYLSSLARSFGLGKATGIDQVSEDAGNLQDPTTEGQAVNMAIGQGTVLVTPLQVARLAAALGNGGTFYRPQLIEKIVSPDGSTSFTFKPEEQGKIPVKPDTLRSIQLAMRSVVADDRGTARRAFTGLTVPVYGKTGSAENCTGCESHAWFAGYTDAKREDKPDIAIAVIAENAGEGSEVAAPIFRRLVEIYFQGKPSTLYRWESNFYVTRTPTPIVTPTLTPFPGQPGNQ